MHNGLLQVREVSLRSWLNFPLPSPHLVSSLQQLPHACNQDIIQFHLPQGEYCFLHSEYLFGILLRLCVIVSI